MVAMTVGGFVGVLLVRSKTSTLLLPFATKSVMPSAVIASPSGADRGFTPFARAAQHWAPGNPPKRWLAPNPGMPKVTPPGIAVLHPNRVKLPRAVSKGGMMSLPEASWMQGLAKFPPPATPLAPSIMLTAMLVLV